MHNEITFFLAGADKLIMGLEMVQKFFWRCEELKAEKSEFTGWEKQRFEATSQSRAL